MTGPMGMTDTAFYVTPDRKTRFAEVYHWDRAQNKLVMNAARTDRGGFEDPKRLESGGGGLVGSTHDYARFCQMLLNKGEIGGKRILKPETVKLMTREPHRRAARSAVDGTTAAAGHGAGALRPRLRGAHRPQVGGPSVRQRHVLLGRRGRHLVLDRSGQRSRVHRHDPDAGRQPPGGLNFRADSARLVYGTAVRLRRAGNSREIKVFSLNSHNLPVSHRARARRTLPGSAW